MTPMHNGLQHQHLEGVREYQRSRRMSRNIILTGLEGGHVEEVVTPEGMITLFPTRKNLFDANK